MMMKLTSLPSTRAEEPLYTDFSMITSPTTPTTTISKIVNFIKAIIKKRIVLYETDIDQIFSFDPNFFIAFFDAYCAQELWEAVRENSDKNCMRER